MSRQHQTPRIAKKSSVLPTAKFTAPPVVQPKAEKKPDTKLPEWKPGGSREPSPLQRLIESKAVQAKLKIGQPNDKYEQEADQVAAQVVQRINAPPNTQPTQGQSVQRQEKPEEELQAKRDISALQASPLSPDLQREVMPEEEELQAKSILQRREAIAGGEASTDLASAINSARGGGQPLDAGLQQSIGEAMGADFSGVRVHTDAQSDQLNKSIQAKAFTTGQDVFFRQGAYQPGSRGGQELIAHELTHVVQQNGEKGVRLHKPEPQPINLGNALHKVDHPGDDDELMKKTLVTLIQRERGKGEANQHSETFVQETGQEVLQRRVAIDGFTVVTPKNKDEIDAYIKSKQQYAQTEENKLAEREGRKPEVVQPLKAMKIEYINSFISKYYEIYSPPCDLKTIFLKLQEWANAKGPSEIQSDESGILPLVSTQDNSFKNPEELFWALVQNIRAERSNELNEEASFKILENLDFYLPTLMKILRRIRQDMSALSWQKQKAIVQAGYAKSLLGNDPQKMDIVELVSTRTASLEKLFFAVNTIHSFIVKTKLLAKAERASISKEMGSRRDKYSPFGPKVEEARRLGYSIWSGFSGSTADILNLARHYDLSPNDISNLAFTTAAFFQFLPTSKNPTHTFHEVMSVAQKYFDVPYDPQKLLDTLPHLSSSAIPKPTGEQVKRVGKYGPDVKEVEIKRLISLHNVPRLGVKESNITDIRDLIKEKGFDLEQPVSVTLLPNNDFLVTGGHHRIAAMKLLGERTIPVKVYQSVNSDPLFLAKMVGIARITGKYFDKFDPKLNLEEFDKVNEYLRDWTKANHDQVLFPYQYQIPRNIGPRL
ncbi:MAG: DUF4157 domain-containing protein [Symploca sp. SIO2E6]|nr:DUF4157 domain-containing protein [Symploca sp. SIO2E6]